MTTEKARGHLDETISAWLRCDVRDNVKIKRRRKNTHPVIERAHGLLAHWQVYQCHPPNAAGELLLSCAISNHLPLPVRPSWPSCFRLIHSHAHATTPCPATIVAAGGLQFCVPWRDKASLRPLGVLFSLSSPPAFLVKVSDLANTRNSTKVLKQWDAVYMWIKRL